MTMATPATVLTEMNKAADLGSPWWSDGIKMVLAKYGLQIDAHLVDIDRELVAARVWYETRGNPNLVSTDPILREVGLLQLSKDSQAQYNVTDPTDPDQNLRAGCLLWSRWAASFRAWALSSSLPLDATGSVGYWAMAWLVTALGPGAIRELSKAAGSASFESVVSWIRTSTDAYISLHATGHLGRQTAERIAYRVAIGGRAATVAVAMKAEGGFMSIGQAALFAAVVAGVALVGFWIWPGGAA